MTFFETATLLSLLIIFVATLVRSTFGFGEALIAMPLLSMTIGLKIAQPLIALLSVCIAISILARDWRHVRFGSAARLAPAAIVGVPLGIYAFDAIPEAQIKLVLAVVIIVFAVYRLWKPDSWRLVNDQGAVFFGFLSGLLGGAYNVTGPPLVMYGTLRNWNAQHFRATLQSVFLPTSVVIAALHGFKESITRDVWFLWACALPVAVVAIVGGRRLNQRFESRRFANLIYYLLIVIGAALIWKTVQPL